MKCGEIWNMFLWIIFMNFMAQPWATAVGDYVGSIYINNNGEIYIITYIIIMNINGNWTHIFHISNRIDNQATRIKHSQRMLLTHLCRPVRSTFAVRETAPLGIMGAPEVPPLCREGAFVLLPGCFCQGAFVRGLFTCYQWKDMSKTLIHRQSRQCQSRLHQLLRLSVPGHPCSAWGPVPSWSPWALG